MEMRFVCAIGARNFSNLNLILACDARDTATRQRRIIRRVIVGNVLRSAR